MKSMLFVEGLSNHIGHILLNEPLLEILSEKYEVHTLCFKKWYQNLTPAVRQYHYEDVKECKIKRMTRTLSALNILKEIRKLDREWKFDIILISTFSYWVTPLWPVVFPNRNKLWILHHDDLDLSRKYPYKIFFNCFVKKYVHLALDSFIREEMQKSYPRLSRRIFELTHPFRRVNLERTSLWPEYDDKFLCISIGRGGNDSFFKKLLALEESEGILEKHNIYLYLKSIHLEHTGSHIIITPRYLSDEEYNGLIYRASALFVCYGDSYHMRISAQLLDALSSYRYVIGSNITVLKVFHERYPKICKAIDSPEEFFEQIVLLKNTPCTKDDFAAFFQDHANERILKQIEMIERKLFIRC